MKKYQKIIHRLERHLMQTIEILGEMEQEASLKFCQEEAKTMTSLLKSLESIRQMKAEMKAEDEGEILIESEAADELLKLRDALTARIEGIRKRSG